MNAKEFIDKFSHNATLIKKYGFVYDIVNVVLEICRLEKIVEGYGFTTERIQPKEGNWLMLYSKILYNGKEVGRMNVQGFPEIMFYKRKRKLAEIIESDATFIIPIEGIHRILGWHSVKGKKHCLAGGETVLHVLPVVMTDTIMEEWIDKLKIRDLVKTATKQKLLSYME